MNPNAVMNTTALRPSAQQDVTITRAQHQNGIATISNNTVQFQTTSQSWCKLVARHMKLVDFLGDEGITRDENGNNIGGAFTSAGV